MPENQPVPTALKILRGNPGHRSLNKLEPKPDTVQDQLDPPKWFKETGHAKELREIWDYLTAELKKINVLTVADLLALEQLCLTYVNWRELAILTSQGAIVDDEGKVSINPAMKAELDYSRQLRILLNEFGLTPSSRSKIKVTGDSVIDPLVKFLQ